MRKFVPVKKLNQAKHERMRTLAYNLLVACEKEDTAAIEQTAGELRGWFDKVELEEEG